MRVELHEAAAPQGTPTHLAHFVGTLREPMVVDSVELLSEHGVVCHPLVSSLSIAAVSPLLNRSALAGTFRGTQTRSVFVLGQPMPVIVGTLVSLLAEGAVSAALMGRELGESLKRRRSCPHCGERL